MTNHEIATHWKRSFDAFHELPMSAWLPLATQCTVMDVGRESVLKENDRTELNLYLILSGSGGVLLWHKNNFICTDMAFDGEFLCDYLSFITGKPTPYQLVTFEPCRLVRVSREAFENFTRQSTHGDTIWRYALQALYIDKHLQQLQSMTATVEELYERMLDHQPRLVARVPQKYLASYFGIAPQSLSRIKANSRKRT